MPALASMQAMGAAAPRPAWPTLRDELQIHPAGVNRDGSPAWHLADPVRNLFFRIGWFEFEMLRRWAMADAQAIADSIRADTTLAPEAADVSDFVQFLQRQELTGDTSPRPPRPLWRWLLHNYLFIRIPLVRPERWLRRCLPAVSWLFGLRFMLLTAAVAITGLVLAARQWDVVQANLRGAMSWDGVVAFTGALVFSKLWHELGHAFTATRFGVRVGHMGVALLVMLPMAYTDTGESWKLAQSRRRLAIASAGILAELVLAAWATFLWSFAPEGNLKNALFFLGTTAWVLTLAVNASPFMRFDGYFILADALDYPGLHERAGRWAKRWVRWYLLGIVDPPPDVVSPAFARGLTVLAFATWLYRFTVFLGIAVIVYHAFFKALGLALFLVEIVTFVVRPIHMELKTWWARRAEVDPRRLRRWLGVLGVLALAVLVPWSGRITAPGVLDAGVEQPIYAPYAARLDTIRVTEGAHVNAGQLMFELAAPLPDADRDKARAMRDAYENAARGAMALDDNGVARQVMAEQMARQYGAQQSASTAELQRLWLTAHSGGVIRDLDPTLHAGSWVSPHTRIATLVDGTHWRVQALIAETDRRRLAPGAAATVYVDGQWGKRAGRIVAVDSSAAVHLPSLLLAKNHGGPIPLNPTAPAGELRPAGAWYRVIIEGDGAAAPVLAEGRATVRLHGQRQSLAGRWIDSAVLLLLQQTGMGKDG